MHLFVAPASPYQAQLLKKLRQLDGEECGRILDRGRHEGTRYVVTDRLVDYPGLFEWISASLKKADGKTPLETAGAWKLPPPVSVPKFSPAPPDPPPATPSATARKSAPSAPPFPSSTDLNREFADLFKTTERPVFSLPLEPAVPTPASSGPLAGAPPAEITRMFSAPAQMTSGQAPVEVPAVFQPPPSQPSAAAGASAKRSTLPLILGLVGMLVVALLIAALLALRPR